MKLDKKAFKIRNADMLPSWKFERNKTITKKMYLQRPDSALIGNIYHCLNSHEELNSYRICVDWTILI